MHRVKNQGKRSVVYGNGRWFRTDEYKVFIDNGRLRVREEGPVITRGGTKHAKGHQAWRDIPLSDAPDYVLTEATTAFRAVEQATRQYLDALQAEYQRRTGTDLPEPFSDIPPKFDNVIDANEWMRDKQAKGG